MTCDVQTHRLNNLEPRYLEKKRHISSTMFHLSNPLSCFLQKQYRLIQIASTMQQKTPLLVKCHRNILSERCLQSAASSGLFINQPLQRLCVGTRRTCISRFNSKLFSHQIRPISITTKAFNSSDSKDLTPGKIFSQETREEMISRLSQVKVPRRLFKKVEKQASVLVPLCTVDGQPAVLLTLRSSNLKSHRGEVSFPGGIQDAEDADVIATALRETEEELGIKPDAVDVWCQMTALPNKSRDTAVNSVVGFVGEIDVNNLQLNRNEVECAFTIPLTTLLDPINQRYTRFIPPKDSNNLSYTLPVFTGGAYRVWGLSAIIMDMVLQTWLPGSYTSMMRKLNI